MTAATPREQALAYAASGLPVFPCIATPGPRRKSPYTARGFHDASLNEEGGPDGNFLCHINRGRSRNGAPRAVYSPRETEAILGISHATLYRLIDTGKLDARKLGSKTLITSASIERLLAELPKAKGAP